MSESNKSRRKFLVIGATTVGAGAVAYATRSMWGNKGDSDSPVDEPAAVTLAEALRHLTIAVGPWLAKDFAVANEFAERFLSPKRMGEFGENETSIRKIVSLLPSQIGPAESIPLDSLNEQEQEFLVSFVEHLYGVDEARGYLRGVPPEGACMGLGHHEKPPSS